MIKADDVQKFLQYVNAEFKFDRQKHL
jgi:hypothetical protein